jgi:hypothetical protein
MAGTLMADQAGRLAHLLRWCGHSFDGWRRVAAHVVYTLAWLLVLIGLPGIYAARAGSSRRTVHALARR